MEQDENFTPSIADIVSSEMDKNDGTLPIENTETTETSVVETPDIANGENQNTKVEENFTVFNPNNLTPELQTVYKKWQSDYTQTRQREKAELQELKSKLAQYEQTNNGTHTEKVEDFNNAKATGEIDPNMSFQDYSRLLIEKAKEEFKTELSVDTQNDYLTSQEKEFMTLDDRFQEGPAFDKILLNHVVSELSLLRDQFEQENKTVLGFDFIGTAKNLISEYDNRIQEANKQFINRQNEVVKGKTIQSQKANPNSRANSGTPSEGMSFGDAFDKAFAGN